MTNKVSIFFVCFQRKAESWSQGQKSFRDFASQRQQNRNPRTGLYYV